MSNEVIYFSIVIIDLSLALLAFKFGKKWVIGFIVTNLIIVTCIAGKVVDILGFSTTVAGPFYAAIFLATDCLTEHYGKKIGYQSVLIGFFTISLFVGLVQLSLLIPPVEFAVELHASMKMVFGTSVRIFIASVIAYLVTQNFDVWFYHFLHKLSKKKHLWLRNTVSTTTSQFIDSIIFFSIAFYGVLPNWIEVAIFGFIVKAIIALLDTPFIYLTYKFKPRQIENE